MSRLIGTVLLIACLPLLAAAQSTDYSKGHGYAYFAPGTMAQTRCSGCGRLATAHIGGGGEGFFTRNLGLGADLGYLTPMRSWGDGIGTFSPNFVVRFRAKDDYNKLEPFVTGGYTLFFRSGTANGFNVGGGVNYWFKDRFGLRFELRDNVWTEFGTVHYVGFRIGVTFR
jgi:hypothetical protein